jgi:hypothetical protein
MNGIIIPSIWRRDIGIFGGRAHRDEAKPNNWQYNNGPKFDNNHFEFPQKIQHNLTSNNKGRPNIWGGLVVEIKISELIFKAQSLAVMTFK